MSALGQGHGRSYLDGRSWTFILWWTLMDNYGRLRTLMDAHGRSWTFFRMIFNKY
jgi:hypothetical protein